MFTRWRLKRDLKWILYRWGYTELGYDEKKIIHSHRVKVFGFYIEDEYYKAFYENKNKLIIFEMYSDSAISFTFLSRKPRTVKLKREDFEQIMK